MFFEGRGWKGKGGGGGTWVMSDIYFVVQYVLIVNPPS
jgi:hypothetical protein